MAIGGATKSLMFAAAHDSLLPCRELIDEGVQAVQPFKGKKLLGAICGQQCTHNTKSRVDMEKYCKKHDIAIWLPNGKDIGVGDSCMRSPALKPCRPSASMQRMPHRCQPPILACHQPHLQRTSRSSWPSIRPAVAQVPSFGFM